MKVLRLAGKVVLGLVVSILILGFIIIPLVLTWAIPYEGTKILHHPVRLHGVGFNPLVLRYTMNGFQILDDRGQVMAGFDRLSLKVSPIDLLKKIYHVQLFEIDGLMINAELLTGNKINLMELVPQGSPGTEPSSSAAKTSTPSATGTHPASASVDKPSPLPRVIIDSIILHEGKVHFTDQTIDPHFATVVAPMELIMTNMTTDPQQEAKIKFHTNLDDKGLITMEALVIPLSQPIKLEATVSLNDYALRVLTPYTGKYTGRELSSGKMNLTMDYRIEDNKLAANHRLMIEHFEFGKAILSKDALHLPFGLAIALLEDPDGKMKINLPVTGDISDPKFQYSHLVLQVVRNFFFNLVTKPFSFLASALGSSDSGTDELGYVRFSPGKIELTASQKEKIKTIIKGLQSRPKLLLEIDGGYDPLSDWKAIQADVLTRDYEKLRKNSDRSESKVYQLLYQRRFGVVSLWALAKKYKEGIEEYNDIKFIQEMKRQLIEHAPPDEAALGVLANARALAVRDFFLKDGFDPSRVSIGRPHSTNSSMGYVPTDFTLTVFDK